MVAAIEPKPGVRPPGRPRDPRADAAILTAVVELLAEVGFGGLTVDAVAHRAGVGKATIYRRWDGKEQLVLDALSTEVQLMATPDTGDLATDLLQIYEPMAEPVAQQSATRLMPALAAEAAVNPELADRLRSFVAMRRGAARDALQRAMSDDQAKSFFCYFAFPFDDRASHLRTTKERHRQQRKGNRERTDSQYDAETRLLKSIHLLRLHDALQLQRIQDEQCERV